MSFHLPETGTLKLDAHPLKYIVQCKENLLTDVSLLEVELLLELLLELDELELLLDDEELLDIVVRLTCLVFFLF